MSTPDPEPVDPNEVRPGPIRKFETKVEEAVAVLWRRPKFIVGACATLVAALLWTGWALRFEEEQSIEDAKQLGRAMGKELLHTASNTEDSRETIAQLVNKDITEEEKQKIIKRKMGNRSFRKSDTFSSFDRTPVRNNPASSNSVWNRRTQEYRKAHREWEKEPQPKPSWKAFALKRYEAWELPLLEKGRQFMDAEDNFIYTQAEEAIIHGRFPSTSDTGEGHIFEVITLGDDEDDFES